MVMQCPTCIYAYIHTYIHTYTYIHAYIHTNINPQRPLRNVRSARYGYAYGHGYG